MNTRARIWNEARLRRANENSQAVPAGRREAERNPPQVTPPPPAGPPRATARSAERGVRSEKRTPGEAANPQSAIRNPQSRIVPDHILSQCPRCAKPIPPSHNGVIGIRSRGLRVVVTRAFWCLFCEQFWIVETWARTAARGGGLHVARPRRATGVEAAIALKAVFRDRGLAAPID